jgi:hypothetical protein
MDGGAGSEEKEEECETEEFAKEPAAMLVPGGPLLDGEPEEQKEQEEHEEALAALFGDPLQGVGPRVPPTAAPAATPGMAIHDASATAAIPQAAETPAASITPSDPDSGNAFDKADLPPSPPPPSKGEQPGSGGAEQGGDVDAPGFTAWRLTQPMSEGKIDLLLVSPSVGRMKRAQKGGSMMTYKK